MALALARPSLAEIRHDPVMVQEILRHLPLKPGSVVVDGTLGLGGHSLRFAEKVRPGGTLVGFDWDESMLAIARERLADVREINIHLVHNDFRNLGTVLQELGLKADGILLDLGLNSAQIEDAGRGLSFLQDGPLDMRMDRSRGEPAAAWLNARSPAEIEQALFDFGDERWARAIAKTIVETRKKKPLRMTSDLVECVLTAIPPGARDKRIHPATRTFQAIRIVMNGELDGLEDALLSAAESLKPGGVLAVLSYHSGEDRIVKRTFKSLTETICQEMMKKPETPTEDEIRRNPRSRSAKLRAIRRI
jgi:16S rRNA (cytosine1402-N4)-methyltransferase